MQLDKFRNQLKQYLRQGGYSQKQLAYELGMQPSIISNKLNQHNNARLNHFEVKQIVLVLARWEAITTRQEALELLEEMGLRANAFTPSEWESSPLNLLVENKPVTFSTKSATSLALQVEEALPAVPQDATGPSLQKNWLGTPFQAEELVGREAELKWLGQQVYERKARLVGLTGLGGIGKSALTFKFAQSVQNEFEYIVWYSLNNAPPPQTALAYFLNILLKPAQLKARPPSNDLHQQMAELLQCLGQSRCLLILDNFETILAQNQPSGAYLSGYEGYGLLLELAASQAHQSCVLLTSREKPKELVVGEKRYPQGVASLALSGLSTEAGQRLLEEVTAGYPLRGTPQQWEEFVSYYSGNPLALKLLSEPLQFFFGGDIGAFLEQRWGAFSSIGDLLGQQLERLSGTEQEILYWLAVERQPLSLEELKGDLRQRVSSKVLGEALLSLERRHLLEATGPPGYFGLQPVIMEYLTERLAEGVVGEVTEGVVGSFLAGYALLKARTRDYIRESQHNLIVLQIISRLELELKGRQKVAERLWELVRLVKTRPIEEQRYEAGNLINLLVGLKAELRGADFSGLRLWEVYLQGVSLEKVNFAWCQMRGSVFTNAFSSVETVAFSPDGKVLASGGLEGTVRLWEVRSGQVLKVFEGHRGRVWSVAFSLDGRLLASANTDHTVQLWDIASEESIALFEGHTGEVFSVAFSPDGKLLASSGNDYTVRLWEVATGKCLGILREHTNEVWSVAFSPDGKQLASGSADETIRLWEIPGGRCLKVLNGGIGWIWSVAFSPDGKRLAGGSTDETIRIWEVASGQCRAILQGHTNRVYSVAFSPDGKFLASGSSDHTVRLWEVAGGECRAVLQGHTNLVKGVTFSPDGKLLASASPDQSVHLWEIENSLSQRIFEGYSNRINAVAFSPDEKYLANGSDDATVRLWEVTGGSLVKTLRGHTGFVKSITFSGDGQVLASGSADHTVRLWEVAGGQCFNTLRGFPSWVWSVAFSPDSKILACSGNDNTIYLWEVSSGRRVNILQGHSNFIRNVAFSPDGLTLASGSTDHTLRLWEVSSGRCLGVLEGHAGPILSIAFSPDGKLLASGSADHTICVWEVNSGKPSKIQTDWVWGLAFSSDGRYLASSGDDGRVQIWDAKSWQALFSLQGNNGPVRTLAFAPHSPVLVGGEENYLRLWDLETREARQVLKNPGLYEELNIFGVRGLSKVEEANLLALGAIRNPTSYNREQAQQDNPETGQGPVGINHPYLRIVNEQPINRQTS